MAKPKSRFNPSLTMPIIDILVAIILIVATGYFWFQTKGHEELESIKEDLRQARQRNAEELAATQATLEEARQEYRETIQLRDAKAQFLDFLMEQIDVEREKIAEARDLNETYTNQVLDLRTEIQRSRDRRLAYNSDILDAETRIAEERSDIAALEAQAGERNDYIDQINDWIARAEERLQEDPPSRFPERSALASYVEIKDPDQTLVFSLSHELQRMGTIDVGLLGSLGVTTDGGSSLKEGGLYANLPIAPRRASIDFEGGVSQIESREEDMSDTSPFAGATLRFAPTPKERLFLVAGTRYSHEDLALRLGLALGRR